MEIAKHMIDDAAELKVWAIKFQKRDLASMPEGWKYQKRDPVTSFGSTYYDHRAALEFNNTQILELKTYAEKKGLQTIVSCFDVKSIIDMRNIGFKYIKLPSQFYSNFAMNQEILKPCDGSDIIAMASTGMHTLKEITDWQFFHAFDILFFCTSIYPCELRQIDFNKFLCMQFDVGMKKIGYSSHDKNGEAIKYFILLGIEYLERHYTPDKKMKGGDHGTVSSNFVEMKEILETIEEFENLRKVNFDLLSEEKKIRMMYRGF
jgi:sialic acid synthase SpsE